nr:hypothetical protein [uncultured Draconibacterium sp.]
MPISTSIKGLQSIKSMQNVAKSGIPNKEESDFIKLHMYEKERSRLENEKIRIIQRLEIIQNRLDEIQAHNDKKAIQMSKYESTKPDSIKSEWKTMSIEY